MRLREYGNFLRVNLSEAIILADTTMELYSPKGDVMVIGIADGLSIGQVDIEIDSTSTFNSGEYLEYEIPEGKFTVPGGWYLKVIIKDTESLRSSGALAFSIIG